ncbi:hypothetical protein YC2023_043131 [Brassica napus]
MIRDMNSKIDMYRGNGITILCRIDETPFPHPSNHPKREVGKYDANFVPANKNHLASTEPT